MSGTNRAIGGLRRIIRPLTMPTWRFCIIAVVTLALALLTTAIKSRTWKELERLEQDVALVEAETYFFGLRLRDGVLRLNGALLRYQLSKSDPVEREAFHAVTREMDFLIKNTLPSLRSADERVLGTQVEQAFRTYLAKASPLLDKTVRAVRRDSSAEVQEQITQVSQPLLSACDRLAALQHKSWSQFLDGTRSSLLSLRRWSLISTVLLVALMGAFAVLVYRIAVAPLHRKLTETQTSLERQEKLACLGALTAGVAHEIRNPLTAIKLRLFSLKKALPASLADGEDVQVIGLEINRLERIVKEFLQFARPAEPEMVEIPAQRLLEEVQGLLRAQLEKQGIALSVEVADSAWLRVDKQQMEQVLINLIQNGAESIGRQGEITLRARHGASRQGGQSRPAVVIEVADTGKGIPCEAQKRLFDPFYSTKQGGTGLGLPIAERIVERHGGVILFQTQLERGTTFQIVLPLIQKNDGSHSAD